MRNTIFKKQSIYLFMALLIAIFFTGTAALCNMCSFAKSQDDDTEKIDVDQNGNNNATTSQTVQENNDGQAESQNGMPVIKLKVFEGPTYAEANDVCFYRIRATVTGNPAPDISWSKDDSNNSFGDLVAQVNLTRDNPNYTLIATAKNSAGKDTESIDLSWGCGGEVNDDDDSSQGNDTQGNDNPVIQSINLSENTVISSEVYAITATASDPDGDNLTYKWSTDDGSFADNNSNPVMWTAPECNECTATITCTVEDGKGGSDTEEISIAVNFEAPDPVFFAEPPLSSESGTVVENTVALQAGYIRVGDTAADQYYLEGNQAFRGFASFDISSLAGKGLEILNAKLEFFAPEISGDLSNFGYLHLQKVNWGAEQILLGDFNLAGTPLASFGSIGNGMLTCSSNELKTELQKAINNSSNRFQVRLHFAQLSDGDSKYDYLSFSPYAFVLTATFK